MSDLYYLTKLPKKEIEKPVLLLLLHGYGSNEDDLYSFAYDLPEDLLVISARAPLSLGFGGYAWYSIDFSANQEKFSDVMEAIHAREMIVGFIDELQQKYHFDQEKSMLLGFSQGAILSYAVALTYPDKIKNVLALSGYVFEDIIEFSPDNEAIDSLRFFCSHGTVDPVIPIQWARNSMDYLKKNSIIHDYHEYPMGHGVSPQNFADLKEWIEKKLE